MKTIYFQIATPERVVFEAPKAEQVTLPTAMGEITVLPEHIPLVANLVPGELRVKVGGEEISMAVSGGFIEVGHERVVVLADTAERAEELDEQRADEARQRAHQLMQEKRSVESTDYTALAAKLEKELARLKVVRKRRDKQRPGIRVE